MKKPIGFQVVSNKSNFFKNALKLMTGNIAAQGIAVLSMPIITRFFTPEMYGGAALYISITTILGLIACLRYEYAIFLPSKDEEAANVLAVSFISVVGITILTSLLVYFTGNIFIEVFHAKVISDYLWLIPIAVLLLGISSSFKYWNSRKKRFGKQAKILVTSSVIMQSLKISAGVAGFASSGILIVTGLLGNIATLLLNLVIIRDDYVFFVKNINLRSTLSAIKKYKKFPLVDLWGGFLNAASWQLPTFMLAFFFSPKIVGFWALGYAVVRMPMTLIGQSVGQVFFQQVSEDKNKGHPTQTVSEVFEFLIAYGLPPMILLGIIGKDLFIIVFGTDWAEAGLYTQILAPWLFFNFVTSTTSTIFYVYEKLNMAFFIHMLIFLSRFISLYIGGILENVYLALSLYSISGVLIYGYVSLLSLRVVEVEPIPILKSVLKHIIHFAPFGLLIYFFKLEFEQVTYLILAGIITILYLVLIVTPNDPIGKTILSRSK